MKKILTILTLLILAFANFTPKAEAKWWIFGQGNDEVSLNYLYLNKNSYDELGQKVTLYSDALPNKLITINGKTDIKKGKVGYVKISLDNKQTWAKAKVSENGAFEYSFTPEFDKTYNVFIEISDTTGKINDVEETYKELTVLNENINEKIKESLDNLFKAYENEESNLFMTTVSPDFAGDEAVLDTAIRKDFNAFDLIKINYFINNISTSTDSKAFVSIRFNRTVVSTKTGSTYTDNGNTELVLKNENGKYKLYNMKTPLMFGLSDAGNVATGTIQSTNNDPILLVDESGNVTEKPFREAIDTIQNNSDISNASFVEGTVTLNNGTPTTIQGYQFMYDQLNTGFEVAAPFGTLISHTNEDINDVTSVNVVAPYDAFMFAGSGFCYHLKFPNDKYMLMYIYPYIGTIRAQYKYQQ